MKNVNAFEAYKKKKDFLMDFQLCRAYLGENCGVSRLVEIILLAKFKDPLAQKKIINTVRATGGKRNAVIDLPRLEFKSTVEGVLATFVENRFDKMVAEVSIKLGNYPLKFREIVEQNL